MKLIVGITGLYCAGKNEAAKIFSANGFKEIDVDTIGHLVLDEKKAEVLETFGKNILAPSGSIDRKKLGNIVFKDASQMIRLEKILHPTMIERVNRMQEDGLVVLNAALLFKLGLDVLCNRILIIQAPLLERINRSMDRDGLGVFSVLRRVYAQRTLIPQSSRNRADILTVENRGTRGELKEKILYIIQTWIKEMGR